uniref:Uncharacterized protein LOC113796854 n=1 Tax=Dermatophagoides pteronyssinus TaxID=6956 RepID=A0A6P6YBY2_DERPT|nr:uncharacterized protein LOC113796854 [Dermatophagoides pteronyssinus]
MIKWQSIALLVLVTLVNLIWAQTPSNKLFPEGVDVRPFYPIDYNVQHDKHRSPDSVKVDVFNHESKNLQRIINQMINYMRENQQNLPQPQQPKQPKITNVNINEIYSPPCSPSCGQNDPNCRDEQAMCQQQQPRRQAMLKQKPDDRRRFCQEVRKLVNQSEAYIEQFCGDDDDDDQCQLLCSLCKEARFARDFWSDIEAQKCQPHHHQSRHHQSNNRQSNNRQSDHHMNASNDCKRLKKKYENMAQNYKSKCSEFESESSFCRKLEKSMKKMMRTYNEECDAKRNRPHRDNNDLLSVLQDQYRECRKKHRNSPQCKQIKSMIQQLKQQLSQAPSSSNSPRQQQRRKGDCINSDDTIEAECELTLPLYQSFARMWLMKCSHSRSSICKTIEPGMVKILKKYIKLCDRECVQADEDIVSPWRQQYQQCIRNSKHKDRCEYITLLINRIDDQLMDICPQYP